ncbi:hypothetical protein UT300012_24610 [Paraclostridium bifermentans]
MKKDELSKWFSGTRFLVMCLALLALSQIFKYAIPSNMSAIKFILRTIVALIACVFLFISLYNTVVALRKTKDER